MINKHKKIILVLIILLGFAFRYYGAATVPINFDEISATVIANNDISFDGDNLRLPLMNKFGEGILSTAYLSKIGWHLFGKSIFSARIIFVFFGVLTIFLIYLLTKRALGAKTALIASFLFAISQFSISNNRLANNNNVLMLMSILSLFIFYKGLLLANKKLILLNGLIIAIGFYFHESILGLIPIYFIFLSVCPKYRKWLRSKYIYYSFLITLCFVLPLIGIKLYYGAPRINFVYNETTIGLSLNAIGLYLGELILILIRPFVNLFNYISSSIDPELSQVNFILGILIMTAVIRLFKDKKPFIRLLIVCFLFNFIPFCFLRRNDTIQSIWSLGSLDWGIMGFIPGVILVAYMLQNFIKQYKYLGCFFFVIIVIFMSFRSWKMVRFPLSCYFPTKKLCIEDKLTDAKFYLGEEIDHLDWYTVTEKIYAESLQKKGENIDKAKDILMRVYNVADDGSPPKIEAALMLAEIFIQQNFYEKSQKYIQYALLYEPKNKRALKLLDKLK